MSNDELIVHERKLLGAIDSFLGGLVHVRPHLAGDYRAELELLAEGWLDGGGANEIDAPDAAWLRAYLAAADRPAAPAALGEFFSWAVARDLIAASPL